MGNSSRFIQMRLIPVTATVALLLSACGSDDPSADPVDPPDTTVAEDGMRAPTPIRLTADGDQAGGRVANASAESTSADMSMIAPAYIVTDYVVGDLPPLPDNTTGYVFDAGAMPAAEDAARVAAALGVEGEPTQTDDGFSVFWRVGPDDGTAPSVTVFDDAMQSWNYDWGWVGRDTGVACASAGEPAIEPMPDVAPPPDVAPDAGAELVDPATSELVPDETRPVEIAVEECPAPEPPVGVPTQAEAEQRATDYLAALGVDTATVAFETYADEWSASVTANEQLVDGVTARSWGFSFGADAELQYAWGSLAAPEPVGPYTLVDLDTAIARLEEQAFGGGGLARGAVDDLATGDLAVSSEITSSDVAVPEPMPVDVPGEAPVEPEEITVTLVDVQADLWWAWDADGSAWLVPAYRFIGDDGGWYTVPAVTDDFLIAEPTPDVPATTVPATTLPPDTGPTDTVAPGAVPTADEIGPLVGSSLDEFTKAADPFPVRVVEIDGEPQAVTMDFDPSRINVAVVGDGGTQYVVRATSEDGVVLGEVEIPGVTIIPIVSVTEGVEGYPACGTEPITHDGVTWYPVSSVEFPTDHSDLSELLSEITSVEREPSPVGVPTGFAPRVAEPGPGDDVGTLVVWADGVARWVSDSGNLDVWLVAQELTYDWVC